MESTINSPELIWGSRVVFFGHGDFGKSTLMGYMRAEGLSLDMNRYKESLKLELGNKYKDDFLYSSIINNFVESSDGYGGRFNTKRYNIRDYVINTGADPILINMVDTPGHGRGLVSNKEFGISKGNIGVFCLAINHFMREENVTRILDTLKIWRAFKKNRKFIIALTQFSRVKFSEATYNAAVTKIFKYISPADVECIIPTDVDFKNYSATNIFKYNPNIPWYNGKTLIEAIKSQNYEIANNTYQYFLPQKLIFSIDKEIERPRSNAGKVWRVFIENGTLKKDDIVTMTAVKPFNTQLGEYSVYATAKIKEFRIDVKLNDNNEDDDDFAPLGSVATINLKDCSVDGNQCHKSVIETSHETIGMSADVSFDMCNKLSIMLDEEIEEDTKLITVKKQIEVFAFGRSITAKIIEINGKKEIVVNLLYNRYFTLPKADDLTNLKIFQNTVIRVSGKNNVMTYLTGTLNINKTRDLLE